MYLWNGSTSTFEPVVLKKNEIQKFLNIFSTLRKLEEIEAFLKANKEFKEMFSSHKSRKS